MLRIENKVIHVVDRALDEALVGRLYEWAVASCRAKKFLLPLTQENVEVASVNREPLPHQVEHIVAVRLKEMLEDV